MAVSAEKSIKVMVSPEQLWPYLVEPEKFLTWWFTVREYKPKDQALSGVGQTFSIEEKGAGPLMKLRSQLDDMCHQAKYAVRKLSRDLCLTNGCSVLEKG